MEEGADRGWSAGRGSTPPELEFTRRRAMGEAPLTDRQKTDKGLYGSYAPPVGAREVTAQSNDGSQTTRGGAAVNSKNAFRSAMLVLVAALIALATPGFLVGLASAADVNIKGTHSRAEIKGACKKAGGTYGEGEKGQYFCNNDKKGTGVNCDKSGKCVGWTPARIQQPSLGIGDVLGGAPLMKQGEPPAPPTAR
jgi:hypothetical protein